MDGKVLHVLLAGTIIFVLVVAFNLHRNRRRSFLSQAQRDAEDAEQKEILTSFQHGGINPHMVCPHCQTKGFVRTKASSKKQGISGGKATAAVLTAGISVLATGLSRKESGTVALCENCKSTWFF